MKVTAKVTAKMIYEAEIHAMQAKDANPWYVMSSLERFKYEVMSAYINRRTGNVTQSDSYEHAFYASLEDLDS